MKKIIIKIGNGNINLKTKNIGEEETMHILSKIISKMAKNNDICKKHFQEIMGKYYDDAE